jgi:predicted ATPase
MWSKGYVADETKAAFARARELTAGTDNSAERFITYFAQWAWQLGRAELGFARETAETFRREAENEGRATELVVGLRMLGLTCIFQGDFLAARGHLEEALKRYDPQRDHDAKFRFGQDAGAGAFTYLAFTNWVLGQVAGTGARMEEGLARGLESIHPVTQANINYFTAIFEIVRGNVDAARRASETVVEVSREHRLQQFTLWGALCSAWVHAHLGDRETGLAEFRDTLEAYTGQGNKGQLPLYQGLLAELEAAGQGTEAAPALINAALARARETGDHWTDAFLHRIRGEILLKGDPTNTTSAEQAFLTAIAIAQQQKARSFELRAALSLARLYQSTDRPADAHAVLVPALEGFLPTPEMSEIGDAQALLEFLEQDETVKAASLRRERRVQLQLAYGAALFSARGYGAAETIKAFDRARELSAAVGGSIDRLALSYGTWLGAVTSQSFEAGSKAAAALLAEATQAQDGGSIAVAHRAVGATLLYGGLFREAKREFDKATSLLGITDDAELARRFNGSPRAAVHILRAMAAWVTSDFDATARDADEAAAQAERADDAMTQGYVYGWAAFFAAIRRDVPLTRLNSLRLLKLVADTGLRAWAPAAEQFERWSRSMSGDVSFSASELRASRPGLKEVGHDKIVTPVIGVLAAEAEVRNGRADEALALVEELITEIRASGLRWHEAELLRVRGEALLLSPSADPERASRDLEAAIAVAREQGARAFELRAALSLGKLHQSTGHPLEARAALATALEGFSPKSEFPEIEEAKRLLAAL